MLRRFTICSAIVFFVPLALGQEVPSRDWPQWRGPDRNAVSTETGLLHEWPTEGPKLLWNSRTVNKNKSVGTGYSSISVAGGRIFTMGDRDGKGYVFALDEKTGEHLWATHISPAQGDGPRCTPTVDGDRVYALSRQGELVCLGVEKGNIIWHTNFKKDLGGRMMSGWDYSESPLVDGDKLVCTPGGDNAALVALDKRTGEIIWKAKVPDAGGAGYASIVVAEVGGIRQYITLLGRSRGVVGIAAKDGKFLWNYNRVANGTANIPTCIVKDDMVFCTTGYDDGGSALLKLTETSNGGVQASEVYYYPNNVLQNHHGGVVLVGDYIYGGHGHNNGLPFCINMKSGKFAWKPVRGAGSGSAALVYADGYLYFRYQNNVMALVKATTEGYRLVSKFNLPGNLGTGWQHPVIVHGKLFIRGDDQILCYDVKQH
ncbi:MAG TPA: PQQ-binding-like beta-propeller repeat protein [Gemmataceae bacterium]|nr:PQQ-binding-like beta-propeller repeat protein [Gemmataceae bacterium]